MGDLGRDLLVMDDWRSGVRLLSKADASEGFRSKPDASDGFRSYLDAAERGGLDRELVGMLGLLDGWL